MSYYISPRFLDKIAVHITKNYLDLPGVKVSLILGIHGRKGEGKSFQCELIFQHMGIEVIHMSAGELESPDAGDPARLIRLRYREAAELSRVRGKMAVLMINDIDAGMGRVDQFTQYTVNTQLVAGTLMNIADNPTSVQLPGSYDSEPIQRIPILVTGNDFSTLYAPLIRDGRMEKFYWEPDRDDRIGIVNGIFEPDRISRSDIENLVDTFPDQSIDFFSALHSRLYDEQIRQFIQNVGIDRISLRIVNSAEKPPEFHTPDFSLPHLIEMGQLMVQEQQRIQELRLIRQYNTPPHNSSHPSSSIPQSSTPQSKLTSSNGASENHKGSIANLNPEALQTLRGLLNQGHRVGIEYVDDRRFRTNSWQCYAIVQGHETESISTLQACLNEHADDYIRLVGIEPKDRRRIAETMIHRPKDRTKG
ncbi:MAG: AAA family ATPase [Cyanobacteria bacterium CRU_2_1]|nr:AAA family ATPase [Cyanobacteria bacterium CRU_2_1]